MLLSLEGKELNQIQILIEILPYFYWQSPKNHRDVKLQNNMCSHSSKNVNPPKNWIFCVKRPIWQKQIQATLSIQVLMTKPRFKRQTILLWPVRIYRQKGILIESFLSLNSIRLQKQSPCANEALHIYFIKKMS